MCSPSPAKQEYAETAGLGRDPLVVHRDIPRIFQDTADLGEQRFAAASKTKWPDVEPSCSGLFRELAGGLRDSRAG